VCVALGNEDTCPGWPLLGVSLLPACSAWFVTYELYSCSGLSSTYFVWVSRGPVCKWTSCQFVNTNMRTYTIVWCVAHTVAIFHCMCWQMSLQQQRGAKWFKGLVQLPGEGDRETQRNACGLPSLSHALDTLQGPLAPLLALTLWVLVISGELPPTWYYTVNMSLTGIYSFRAFIAIATKRVRTIKSIAAIQRSAPGTIEDKRRRMHTLKGKTIGVVLDLLLVLTGCCVTSVSYFVSQSFFSSRRLILNCAFAYTFGVLALISVGLQIHKKIGSVQKRLARVEAITLAATCKAATDRGVKAETEMSGISVVEQSCIDGSGGGGRKVPKGGLFSEVATEA
jgi:hypothetical protein